MTTGAVRLYICLECLHLSKWGTDLPGYYCMAPLNGQMSVHPSSVQWSYLEY